MRKVSVLIWCTIIAFSYSCSKEKVDEYAMITFMIGDVKKNNLSVGIGDIIKEKDVILTAEDSFCDVKIGSSIIRIKEKSRVIVSNLLRSNNLESTELGLNVGKMLCKPKKLLKSESFVVKTPTAVAGVRGTKFTVEADKMRTTRIKVFDGKVKVAKRIKQFEGSTQKVLELAPVVADEKKVIITEAEVKKVEKAADKLIKDGSAKELAVVITRLKNDVVVSKAAITGFKVADFAKENKEIIAIQPKPKAVIKQIIRVIQQEKELPKPDGRLLVTRYEIYFIKNGKVLWEGTVVESPIKMDNRIYIASGDYVFCASDDGPVLWRKKINNDGKLKIENNELSVFSRGQATKLDLETGEKL
jgi:hypothetical protein